MCIGYSAEVGGRYLLLDELYLAPECRGKGYGEQVIRWAMEQHPECARYRLEVTGENRAGALFCASHLRGRERGVSRTVERDQLSARVTVSQ